MKAVYALIDDQYDTDCQLSSSATTTSSSSSNANNSNNANNTTTTIHPLLLSTNSNNINLTTSTQWYTYYSKLYPTLHYIKYQQQLEIEKAELIGNKRGLNEVIEKRDRSKSWFWRLFDFGSSNDDNSDNNNEGEDDIDDNDSQSSSSSEYETPTTTTSLHYINQHPSTIKLPSQAISFQRFHLVSEQRALSAPTSLSSSQHQHYHLQHSIP